MGKIIVLDENTSNKIAAGEVVERPASVIKELVENSIDAGATNISVDIRNGGISYIKVTDNGSGMDVDDVEIAFERHATSKIKKAEDLDSIITMGFRGEALASIAAVSSVELQTKTSKSTYGMYVHIVGGIFEEVRQTGCPDGTTFIVKDLFFNTPARYKFLKKDATEATYISDTISRIALGNPNIAFKLVSGKSTLVHTPGNNDLKSAIFSIYGKEMVKELMPVEYEDERFKISGYVGKPEAARANRNYQSLYINRRYIKSIMVSFTVEQAYQSILMKNKFPFFVLYIDVNPQLVDANVHPNKMDVRFANEGDIHKAVYMAVSQALTTGKLFNPVSVPVKDRELFKIQTTDSKKEYTQEQLYKHTKSFEQANKTQLQPQGYDNNTAKTISTTKNNLANNSINNNKNNTVDSYTESDKSEEIRLFTKALEPLARTDIKNISPVNIKNTGDAGHDVNNQNQQNLCDENINQKGDNDSDKYYSDNKDNFNQNGSDKCYSNTNLYQDSNLSNSLTVDADGTYETGRSLDPLNNKYNEHNLKANEDIENTYNNSSAKDEKNEPQLADMKYIGQAFLTYIILQDNDELVLVDQHAAHERIIYEKLKAQFESQENTTQLLLEPVVIQLQAFELEAIKSNFELFDRIGFVFEDFGNNSIIIRGIPYSLEGYSPKDVFLELADKIQNSVKPVNTPIADDIIHMIACKAAIKANKKLDDKEVHQLLIELANTGRRYTCPHGRPTVIRLTKYEIEKMFKRIV